MNDSVVASSECGRDATANPAHLTEQMTSDPVDDCPEFLEVPRLAEDLRDPCWSCSMSFKTTLLGTAKG